MVDRACVLIACILIAVSAQATFAQVGLRAGPVVGHVDMRSARIWIQTWAEANVRITYRDNIVGKGLSTRTIRTRAEDGNCLTFDLDSIEPGRKYEYHVIVDNVLDSTPTPTTFTSRPIWKYRGNTLPPLTIAVGSCNYVNQEGYERYDSTGREQGYGSEHEIFYAIKGANPDAMIWLGDNTYLREPDWNSRSGMIKRYSHTRALTESRALFSSVPNYATWDDHDYGPNDSDRSWWGKKDALEIFRLFWPNPSFGVMDKPGVTTSFELVDVQFFLLDDRYYRSSNDRKDGDRTILGEHQIQWLIDALASSTATFRVIVVGSQFLTDNLRKECFSRIPEERERIIELITENKIPGVLFVTGDIHAAELSKLDRSGTYPLYDFTSSSLTAGSNKDIANQSNKYRVPGTEYGGHNFGLISVSGDKGARVLTLRIMDKDGKAVWKREIGERELR
ncbi:MAG: alkaline phosphatase D family protein [Candidatus Kapabacteria bacterium]|nr:alkaline phosphatase D family protein [Candidatus Kapabacteria bacterium]